MFSKVVCDVSASEQEITYYQTTSYNIVDHLQRRLYHSQSCWMASLHSLQQ